MSNIGIIAKLMGRPYGSGAATAANPDAPLGSPSGAITELGQWFDSGGFRTTIASGSQLRFRTSGTATVKLNFGTITGNVNLPIIGVRYKVEGGSFSAWSRIQLTNTTTVGGQSYYQNTLLTSLNTALTYEVQVVANISINDSLWGSAAGLRLVGSGIVVDAAALTGSVVTTRPNVLAIGDSITAGEVALGYGQTPFPPDYAGVGVAEQSYVQVASQTLDFLPHLNAFGGTGIYATGPLDILPITTFNYQPGVAKTSQPAYEIITINAGQNDGEQNSTDFQAAYNTFVANLKTAYPLAKIVLIRPLSGSHASDVQAVATTQNVYYMNTTGWTFSAVDGIHPNVAGHAQIAALYAADLRAKFPVLFP